MQLPLEFGGLEGRAVCLSTEGDFPHKRLVQLQEAYRRKHQDQPWSRNLDFLSNVLVERVTTVEQQNAVLFQRLPRLFEDNERIIRLEAEEAAHASAAVESGGHSSANDDDVGSNPSGGTQFSKQQLEASPSRHHRTRASPSSTKPASSSATAATATTTAATTATTATTTRPFRLLVIDSIAAIMRAEYGSDELDQRAYALFGLAAQLKYLSWRYKLVVLVVNQVLFGG